MIRKSPEAMDTSAPHSQYGYSCNCCPAGIAPYQENRNRDKVGKGTLPRAGTHIHFYHLPLLSFAFGFKILHSISYMILPDHEIRALLREGSLVIEPLAF